MLPPDQLQLALDIHARSYKLLRWLAGAINAGEIPIPRVTSPRHAEDVTEATLDWIRPLHPALPSDMRPDPDKLEEFAAFFGTYLTSSFDLANDPGTVLRNPSDGSCFCPICARIVSGSHLKTKKLYAAEKHRAYLLMIHRLCDLANEHELTLSQSAAEALIEDSEHRMAAAYSTYGYWLIQRMKGLTDGASILALWREFAWTRQGSPRKEFTLKYDDIAESETKLVASIRELDTHGPQ